MKYFLIFFLLTMSFSSLAKIHIEPYVGYGFTVINKTPATKETLDGIKNSFNYFVESNKHKDLIGGLRLGYKSIGLAVGLDLSAGAWQSLNSPNLLTVLTAGAFASYNLPLLFRVYGVLIPKTFARVSLKTANKNENLDVIIEKAAKNSNEIGFFHCHKSGGAKLGLSYLSIPFLSINFEYQTLFIDGSSPACGVWSHTGSVFINFMI